MSQDIPGTQNQALPPASFAQPQVHAGITQLERSSLSVNGFLEDWRDTHMAVQL